MWLGNVLGAGWVRTGDCEIADEIIGIGGVEDVGDNIDGRILSPNYRSGLFELEFLIEHA